MLVLAANLETHVSKQWLLQLVSLELRKFGGVVLFDTKTEFNF